MSAYNAPKSDWQHTFALAYCYWWPFTSTVPNRPLCQLHLPLIRVAASPHRPMILHPHVSLTLFTQSVQHKLHANSKADVRHATKVEQLYSFYSTTLLLNKVASTIYFPSANNRQTNMASSDTDIITSSVTLIASTRFNRSRVNVRKLKRNSWARKRYNWPITPHWQSEKLRKNGDGFSLAI